MFKIPAGYDSQDDSVTGTGRSWENTEAMSTLICLFFGQWGEGKLCHTTELMWEGYWGRRREGTQIDLKLGATGERKRVTERPSFYKGYSICSQGKLYLAGAG